MRVKRIIFWRHGQTDANRDMRIQGAIDIPLNELGHRQAAAAARELVKLSPSRLYCSDLTRAQQTAGELVALTGLAPVVDARLRERSYGSWEGLTAEEIMLQWRAEYEGWKRGQEPGLDIETRAACGQRMAQCVRDAVRDVEAGGAGGDGGAGAGETLVFASHGGAITCAISELLGLDPSHWQGLRVLDNCHWAMLIPRMDANPQWRLVMYDRWNVDTADMDYPWEK